MSFHTLARLHSTTDPFMSKTFIWKISLRCQFFFTGMRRPGISPTRPSCCKMHWSVQADWTWLRGCGASTGVTRSWAEGLSCPLRSPFSSQSTRPCATRTHCWRLTTLIIDPFKSVLFLWFINWDCCAMPLPFNNKHHVTQWYITLIWNMSN